MSGGIQLWDPGDPAGVVPHPRGVSALLPHAHNHRGIRVLYAEGEAQEDMQEEDERGYTETAQWSGRAHQW